MSLPIFQPHLVLPPDLDFTGRTVVITGATAGLGRAAAKHFLEHKTSHLILAVRNTTRGNAVREALLSAVPARHPEPIITVMELDLMRYASVVEFVKALEQKITSLDVLVLNAGFGAMSFKPTPDSHEQLIQVNLYANALLALSCIPLLRAGVALQRQREKETKTSSGSRTSSIVWTSSFTQFQVSMAHVNNLLKEQDVQKQRKIMTHFDDPATWASNRYAETKLLVSMYVAALATRINAQEIVVMSVDPGFVQTEFIDEHPLWIRIPIRLAMKLVGRTSEQGAITYLHAATLGEEAHGRFLSDNLVKEYAPFISTPGGQEMSKRLWDEIWEESIKHNPQIELVFK